MIKEAFEQGQKFRIEIARKNNDIQILVKKLLDSSKRDKFDFMHLYIETCLKYEIGTIKRCLMVLENEEESHKFALSLVAGMMSEIDRFITTNEAIEIFEITNSSTVRRAIIDKRISEKDYYKDANVLKVRISALDKLYKRKEVLK
jgi:hypothetical protein